MNKAQDIRAARQTLRDRGEPESMNAVRRVIGGSKATIAKYWSETTPAEDAAAADPVHVQAQAPGQPVPAPAPVPTSPELSLETLRAYYRSAGPAPWGSGARWPDAGRPPLAAYGLLSKLYQEADTLVVKAWQAWMQAKNEAGQVRGTHDDPSVHQAEERWSTERSIQSRIKSDVDNMQERAHYEGKALTT